MYAVFRTGGKQFRAEPGTPKPTAEDSGRGDSDVVEGEIVDVA